MCERAKQRIGRRRRQARALSALACAFCGAISAVSAPGPAQAQVPALAPSHAPALSSRDADARVAELHARFIRAAANSERHKARLAAGKAALDASRVFDSVRAGSILIVTRGDSLPPRILAALRSGADMAWTRMHAYLDSSATFIDGHAVELRHYVGRRPGGPIRPYSVLELDKNHARARSYTGVPSAADVADNLQDQYGSLAANIVPRSLMAWSRTSWVPLVANTDATWQDVAVALATSRSSIARRCYGGAMDQCTVALQLDRDSTTDRVHEWYLPEDIPALVSEWAPSDSAMRALVRTCVDTRATDVCEHVARVMTIPAPLPDAAKTSLIGFALERGGHGAFTRLVRANGTAAQVLATTAGVGIEQLLTEWRAKAVAATPPHTMPGPLEGVTLLAWTALFAALATRRRP